MGRYAPFFLVTTTSLGAGLIEIQETLAIIILFVLHRAERHNWFLQMLLQLDLAKHVKHGCKQEDLVGLIFNTVGVR